MGSEEEMKVKDGKTFLQLPENWAELGERLMGGERRIFRKLGKQGPCGPGFRFSKQPRGTM